MADEIDQAIRKTAGSRCEYCRFPEAYSKLKHVLDHVIAKQHGGRSGADNLALCCGRCNQFKGPNLAGLDPESGTLSRLFHPRQDVWSEHFRYDGAILRGTSPLGRATIEVLRINLPLRIAARQALMDRGVAF